MLSDKFTCNKEQDELLEAFLAAEKSEILSADLWTHLEHCASCREYWRNLAVVRSAYTQDRRYSPLLRANSLRRLANGNQKKRIECLALAMPGIILSLSLSYVLPAWLLARLFSLWTPSTAAAYAAALGIMLIMGLLITSISAISLIERGYIRLEDSKRIPHQYKYASMQC
jgi:hypothetical protein